jgi:hypothetical protein
MLATNVPLAIAAKPAACLVMCGGNDIGNSVPLTTIYSNLTQTYAALRAAGIEPIVGTYTPRSGQSAAFKKALTQLNNWIIRNAALNGYSLVDFGSYMTDSTTGDWIAGYDTDGIHPSAVGAKFMGQILSDAVAGTDYLGGAPGLKAAVGGAWLPTDNADTANILTNGMMMTDSGAPVGRPTGWSVLSGAPSAEVTATDITTFGKYYSMTGIANVANSSGSGVAVAGDLAYMCCRLGTTVKASAGSASITFRDTGGSQDFISLSGWTEDIPLGSVLAYEFTMPTTGNQRFRVNLTGAVNAGSNIKIGQVAALNLTAAGVTA